ncbi:CBO0543 family protein [Ornithinibacillus salinisoli]|uniref:CBO0543 family protein n=1 Tax=Ornithinibacillus salinisoli TaxID=1848459 RepID=A0ABW4W8A8_9BACI
MFKNYINIGFNVESIIYIFGFLIGLIFLIYFLRLNWKKYGILFILSALVGNILCYIFVKLNFYSFPYVLFPKILVMPLTTITLTFPIMVLLAVRYSPDHWGWKIPFYSTIVHVGMFWETWALTNTRIIEYNFKWDFWDSYTWWWIFFLLFEWIGGSIIPNNFRKPINIEFLKFGKLGWAIIHFILIVTVFLGGYYLGSF